MSHSKDVETPLSQTMTRISHHAKSSKEVAQLPEHPLSQTTSPHSNSTYFNPFEDVKGDEKLDPRSENFDIHAWLRSVMQIAPRDPENFPVHI
jgi:hypothetical protein